MDANRMKQLRSALEGQIAMSVHEFQQDTGLEVSSIHIHSRDIIGRERDKPAITTDVRLPR